MKNSYIFCITMSIVSLTGWLVKKFSTSDEARTPFYGLFESATLENITLYLIGSYGKISWFKWCTGGSICEIMAN